MSENTLTMVLRNDRMRKTRASPSETYAVFSVGLAVNHEKNACRILEMMAKKEKTQCEA